MYSREEQSLCMQEGGSIIMYARGSTTFFSVREGEADGGVGRNRVEHGEAGRRKGGAFIMYATGSINYVYKGEH